ncbi:MAG: tyrosine-protein phosphatase [Gaiellaceae bacterium]
MIDLHTHILPGLDDGVATVDEARELARRAAAEGVTVVAATPHVRDDYPTTVTQMVEAVDSLHEDFARQGLQIDVLRGAEIAIDRLPQIAEPELAELSLAGSRRYLLLEFPYSGWPPGIAGQVRRLLSVGLVAVLAHPERNREVQAEPERLGPLVEAGALVQITAASLDGRLGPSSRKAAQTLIERGHAHLLASDAHGPSIREAGLAAAASAVGNKRLARWLTEEAPAAIVAGEPLPERPRRGWFRR